MTYNMADSEEMGRNGLNETPGNNNHEEEIEESEEENQEPGENFVELVEAASTEYNDLNKTLDEIDKWMNDIESQNDSLVSRMKELLEENRQIRAELQQENASQSNCDQAQPPPSGDH